MLWPVLVTGIELPSPTCTDGNKRLLKIVLKLLALEFKWEEAPVSIFHVGSCTFILLNTLGSDVGCEWYTIGAGPRIPFD